MMHADQIVLNLCCMALSLIYRGVFPPCEILQPLLSAEYSHCASRWSWCHSARGVLGTLWQRSLDCNVYRRASKKRYEIFWGQSSCTLVVCTSTLNFMLWTACETHAFGGVATIFSGPLRWTIRWPSLKRKSSDQFSPSSPITLRRRCGNSIATMRNYCKFIRSEKSLTSINFGIS